MKWQCAKQELASCTDIDDRLSVLSHVTMLWLLSIKLCLVVCCIPWWISQTRNNSMQQLFAVFARLNCAPALIVLMSPAVTARCILQPHPINLNLKCNHFDLCRCEDCWNVYSTHSTQLCKLTSAGTRQVTQQHNIWKSDWIQEFPSGGCPDSFSRGGKKVFCYYEGKKSPGSIDPCPCTHLLYKNVQIDPDSRLRLSSQVRVDLDHLRSSKPSLAVLLSIGGDVVESDTFRAIVSR